MKRSSKTKSLVGGFLKNECGQIGIMFALLIIPIVLFLGATIDFSFRQLKENKLQQSVDVALLAALKADTPEIRLENKKEKEKIREKIFQDVFAMNFKNENPISFKFKFKKTSMAVDLKTSVDTMFLNILSMNKLDVTVTSETSFNPGAGLEIVLIFDATGSMRGIISNVKRNAINFTDDLISNLKGKGVDIDNIETKVISYKDYWVDSDPMLESKFYSLPKENKEFSNFINPITAGGGGDLPESALEAIVLAMNSKSSKSKTGVTPNKLIVLWTDIEAIPLADERRSTLQNGLLESANIRWASWYPWYSRSAPNYPSGMPRSLNEMKGLWDKDIKAELLLFYGNGWGGVNFYPWKQMKKWPRTTHIIGNPNSINYSSLIDKISNTISKMTSLRVSH